MQIEYLVTMPEYCEFLIMLVLWLLHYFAISNKILEIIWKLKKKIDTLKDRGWGGKDEVFSTKD